ncbi:MAG: transglutaminase family protein [Minwuia sp.]|nr:transglutaminase family protein [Minwuia sp.]
MTDWARYRIRHRTAYRYGADVLVSQHLLYLTPRTTPHQQCIESRIVISPVPGARPAPRTDLFGNVAHHFDLDVPHDRFAVTASSLVAVAQPNWPEPSATPAWDDLPDRFEEARAADDHLLDTYRQRIEPLSLANGLHNFAMPSFPAGQPVLAGALDLTRRIFRDFAYDPEATTVTTPLATVLRTRRGVCQDFARVMIAALRTLGLAAGYVSGYLVTEPPEGQARLVGADQSHAWVRLHIPGFGWVDLDPTNGVLTGNGHITVAWGRGFRDVVPVKGVITGGGEHELKVEVDVIPEAEIPASADATPAGQAA